MHALTAIFALSCAATAAPGLQQVYCRAVAAWVPFHADVRAVKWCEPGECTGMGGGMYQFRDHVIEIDPHWPFQGDGLLLTLEHEYGHALGLGHRSGNSIMKPGWDPPWVPGPTSEDFGELRRRVDVPPGDLPFASGRGASNP